MAVPMSAALLQEAPGGFAIGDFWSLTQQAGPLRWPIFLVLGIGLIQVFLKLYELVRDRSASSALRSADLTRMSLDQLTTLVSRQEQSMLATLEATMLNVFQTRPAEGMLHDEITNFVQFQQDQFEVFRRRMDFLSDTAGALGLMGTVWGMFTVFFQGTAEQDVILRGMGIALITTLLGLVVSIILNFSATELSTFFSKRLEQVSTKADELRFRLMELAPRTAPAAAETPAPPADAPRRKDAAAAHPSTGPAAPAVPSDSGRPATAPEPARVFRYVEFQGNGSPVRAGATTIVGLTVLDGDGGPAAAVPVFLKVADGEATPRLLCRNSRGHRRAWRSS
jgi:biopolymer transport protein ExbB/TolQ